MALVEGLECVLAEAARLIDIPRHVLYLNIVIFDVAVLKLVLLLVSGKVLKSLNINWRSLNRLTLPLVVEVNARQSIQLLLDVHELNFGRKF